MLIDEVILARSRIKMPPIELENGITYEGEW